MNRAPLIVLLALTFSTACGSSSNSGTGDTGNGAAGSSTSNDAVCSSACLTASSCAEKFDQGACQARCKVELQGQGTLDKAVAARYFPMFAAAKTCEEAMSGGKGPPFGQLYDQRTELCGKVQTDCEATLTKLCGVEYKDHPEDIATTCFRSVCVTNQPLRSAYTACMAEAKVCVDFVQCRASLDAQMASGPWWGQAN